MDPQSDADKIRLKRLEKLQVAQKASSQDGTTDQQPSSSSSSPAIASSSTKSGPSNGTGSPSPSGTQTPRNPPSTSSSSSAAKQPLQTPYSSKTVASATPSAAIGSPAKARPASGASTSVPVTPSTNGTSSPRPAPGSSSSGSTVNKTPGSAVSAAATAALQIPYPQWFSGVVSRIFAFTLSQARAESSNWQITYLYTLHDELLEDMPEDSRNEANLRFDEDNVDAAIVARLSMDPEEMSEADEDPVRLTVLASLPGKLTNLEYLVSCWKRWPAERNKLPAKSPSASDGAASEVSRRIAALDLIKRKVLENIGLQLQEPSLFPQPSGKPLGGLEFVPALLQLPSIPASPLLPLESHQVLSLLGELAATYSTATSSADLVDVLGVPVLQAVIDKLGAKQSSIQAMLSRIQGAGAQQGAIMDLTGMDWRGVVRSINDLTEIKPIANMFVDMPNWIPENATPSTFEIESLVGPLLRLGCFPDAFPTIGQSYFAQPSALSREAIEASSNALRSTLASLQQLLYSIFNSIVRSSANSREGVLKVFSHVVKINSRRDGMRVDRRTVASDGYMLNSLSVLIDFCVPFMDASFSKIDKIDPEYLRKCKGRIDVSEMTKMHATQEEARDYYGQVQPDTSPAPNFISEIFYLTTSYMHYGLYPALTYQEALHRHMRNLREDLKEAEDNHQFDGTPQEAAYRGQVERMKKEVDAFHSRILASEVQLLDTGYIAKCATFASFVMTWLVRLVDPKGKHPQTTISLEGLPEETPLAFKMLPEYLVEDVTEFYFFVSRYAPQMMIELEKDQLLVFIIVFLCTPYINNPYLKGKFVEILYRNTRSWGPRYPKGVMGDMLNFHPLALSGLLPALMRVYCQIEYTGQHNQFYEKFEVRHQIAKILKLLWETKEHREAFKAETSREDFVRFVNYLLNDTTFLLDESLSKLKLIHEIQLEMADKATWDAQPEEQRKDREKLFRQSEGQATSFLIYTYEVLHLTKTLTAEAPGPFLKGEIVDRLAASLDFNLNVLAGPRCQDLKVQDREKYRFRPRELLGDIIQIIINLADNEQYAIATAKDGRSYSKSLFDNAIRIAARAGLKSEGQLSVLRKMVEKIEGLRAAEAEEEEMGETPDEYLDPLTAEIMVDPVVLPASGLTIDFNTIKQHLLTTPQDPFNRTPLKIEDVRRDDKLREEIEAFRAKRRQERLERLAASQAESEVATAESASVEGEGGDTKMEE